ncbi:hypothetical protein [Brevibacterium casei]|uniref:hypothetical protein n=1 Tax=Brevibacterium casei TaxID=33889 RepID=UPI00186BA269|nr:hypothetical protein [Brevibacterium casei]MBE4693234.1 hypothetical protein [Brevibacterium casei]MBY3576357.1 hypothetical protein [Brevibacterium casei]MCT2359755.1 hypothetical protein [Brevibacterium casei]MDH5147441.1 hypothetical protein [Brevibacterium casei]QQT69500.1 hypothetical protein I6I57_00685 [Brevibacterium casei]
MKRLILATTLALAVTTLGAMPAAATAPDIVAQASSTTDPSPDPAADADGSTDEPDGTSTSEGTDDAGAADGTDTDSGTADTQGQAEGGVDGTTGPTTPGEADTDGTDETEGTDDTDGTPTESPEAEPLNPALFLDSGEVTVSDITNPDVGLRFFVEGVLAGDTIAWGDGDGTHATAQEDGTFTGTFFTTQDVSPGDTVTVTVDVQRGEESATLSASATVIEGEGETEPPADTSTLDISPGSQQLNDFLKGGVDLMMTGCNVDSEVSFRISTMYDPDTTVWETTQVAGEDAAAAVNYTPPEVDDGYGFIGEYLVMASCGDQYEEGSFTVTPNGSDTIDLTFSVDPERLPAVDFINRDKGVTMTMNNCTAGEVRFQVWGFEPGELLYDRTAPTNEVGRAAVQTYGLSNDASAYVGKYQVEATCGEETLTGQFVVTASGGGGGGDNGNGGGSGGGGGNSGSMPRTGAELTGLGAGALLILAGAGAVLFARRRGQLEK